MSESKHTPGPWTFDGDVVTGMDSRTRFAGTPSNDIFDVHEWPEELYDEGVANARLIAAAPDLLAACKAAADAYSDHGSVDDGTATGKELDFALGRLASVIVAAEEVR